MIPRSNLVIVTELTLNPMIWLIASLGLVVISSTQVLGCPFCSSEVGLQVGATVFGTDVLRNVATISLPFFFLSLPVAWLFCGGPIQKNLPCRDDHDK
jgi:hypothetical protein